MRRGARGQAPSRGGHTFPADPPWRKQAGPTIRGGPRDREEDPWEGANGGPEIHAGRDVAGRFGQPRTFRAVSWSHDCLRRAQTKKVERLRGRSSSRLRLERRWRVDLAPSPRISLEGRAPSRPGCAGASRLVRAPAAQAVASGRDRSGTDRGSVRSWFRTGVTRSAETFRRVVGAGLSRDIRGPNAASPPDIGA